MRTIFDVANYFLCQESNNESDITNMKLQKLCYYAQGVYMSMNDGIALFEEELVHWEHGPVCKDLYHQYKSYNSSVIDSPKNTEPSPFNKEQTEILFDVYSYFGQFSAWKLRNMTHEESPWLNTVDSQIIEKSSIHSYFKDHIVNG